MKKTRKELKAIIDKLERKIDLIFAENIHLKGTVNIRTRKLTAYELEVSILKKSLKAAENVLYSNKGEIAECLEANDALFKKKQLLIEERKILKINLQEVKLVMEENDKLKSDLIFANKLILKLIE